MLKHLLIAGCLLPLLIATAPVWGENLKKTDWNLLTDNAGWPGRDSQGEVVYKDKMWIFGGWFSSYAAPPRDVWNTSDGKIWEQATKKAAWSPRAYHQAVVFDGKIWVCGGGNYVPRHHALNDVWCSKDGANWTKVTDAAQWGPRLWFSALVYRDRMWVIGGWSKKTDNYGDVWHCRDGKNWRQLQSDIVWKSRHEHSALVFQDKIWVMGGYPRPKLSNEVWSLYIPPGR